MTYSKYKQKKIEELKRKVFDLYKQGYTMREVRDLIKCERSHTWIMNSIKELEMLDNTSSNPLIHTLPLDKSLQT